MLKRAMYVLTALVMAVTLGVVNTSEAQANQDDNRVYTQPGHHLVNGRYWRTTCEKYSTTVVRCKTDIWATTVVQAFGRYVVHDAWVFNTLTYLPSDRSNWKGNPLASPGDWVGRDGRRWRTECDTPKTGRGACRSYAVTTTIVTDEGEFTSAKSWVVNNIVLFATDSIPAVTSIPAAAPALSWVPKEKPIVNDVADQAVRAALTKVGSRYVWGTSGPDTFDCSGLTSWAYRQVGIDITRSSRGQWSTVGRKVSKSELKPGDLVFYYSPVSHVGLYIGNGKIVDAANPRSGIRVTSLDSMPYTGARRVVG